MKFTLLSYPISAESPGWPGNPSFKAEPFSQIAEGNSANTYMIHLFNHFGTHFDAPRHYNEKGKKIAELPLESFIYEHPLLLDIPKGSGEKILKEDLVPHAEKLVGCDLLLLRTRFAPKRISDPDEYAKKGPAVGSSAAKYLVENFSDSMKAIAVDFISLACPLDTQDGDLAHRYMLGDILGKYICIIEDVCLEHFPSADVSRVFAIPLFFTGVDSGPVTVFAESRN